VCGCTIQIFEHGQHTRSLSNHERYCQIAIENRHSRTSDILAGGAERQGQVDEEQCFDQGGEEPGEQGGGSQGVDEGVLHKHKSYNLLSRTIPSDQSFLRVHEDDQGKERFVFKESESCLIERSVRPAESIIEDYQKKKMECLTRRRVPQRGYNSEIMLLMNRFGTHMQLSEEDGDLFLACVNDIIVLLGSSETARGGGQTTSPTPKPPAVIGGAKAAAPPLPPATPETAAFLAQTTTMTTAARKIQVKDRIIYKTWRALKKQCNGELKDIAPIKEMLIGLPKPFPTHEDNTNRKLLNSTRCFHVCILTRIGDALLRVKNVNFHTSEIIDNKHEDGVRHFSSFVTGHKFERYCKFVRRVFGEGVSPLMVAFYFDETAMSTTRSACPLFMSIMNVTGTCYRPILLGFCPVKLAYNEKQLRDIIAANDMDTSEKGLRYAYALAKRKAMDMYIFNVIEPILQYQDCGLTVLVGQGQDQTTQRMVPFLSHFIGDSAALHAIANVSPLVMKSPCRCCTQTDCCDFLADPSPARNSQKMSEVTKALEELLSPRAVRAHGVALRHLTLQEKGLKAFAKSWGVIPGGMMLPSLHRNVPQWLNNYYTSLCVDLLHTLLKGLLESVVAWILQIVLGFSKSKHSAFKDYTDCSKRLDMLLSQFPQKHALLPVRFWHFVKGATCFMKSEALKAGKQGGGTGMFTGGFPAWHFPPLALQILLCFGCCGGTKTLVPNFPCVHTDHGAHYNPNSIIIATLASVLEVHFMCAAKALKETDLNTLVLLTKNANIKVVQLFDFKQNLLRVCRVLKTVKNPAKKGMLEYSRNIKQHLLTHLPAQILEMGADSRGTDTEVGEHELQDCVKVAFRKSNKDLTTTEMQMLKHGIEREFSLELLEHQFPEKYRSSLAAGQANSPASEREQKVKMSFKRVINMGSSELEPTSYPPGIALKHALPSECALSTFIHPLLEYKELHEKLAIFVRDNQFEWKQKSGKGNCFMYTWFHSFHKSSIADADTVSTLLLAGGLSCRGHVDEGIAPFHIRATSACSRTRNDEVLGKQREHAFSFLEVSYKGFDGTFFVKVLAIVKCRSTSSSVVVDGKPLTLSETYLCVARLEKCQKNSKFPFPKYNWEMQRAGCRLSLDILPLDCIVKPAFMVPVDLTKCGIENPSRSVGSNYFASCSWICIPFARCVLTVNEPYARRCEVDSEGKNIFCNASEMASVLKRFERSPLHVEDEVNEDDFGIGEGPLQGDDEHYGLEGHEDMDLSP